MTNTTARAKRNVVLNTTTGGKLHRKLQARHLEMIAIGGTIGTGLLLRSGRAIAHAEPLGALLCFAIVAIQVFGVASSIGEMATYMPVEGAVSAFPARFVNCALGFAAGWNYVASWVWSLVYMVPLVTVNLAVVTGFAETEFVLCVVKVIAICLFIIGICVWFGAGSNGNGPLWFKNSSPAVVGDRSLQSFLNIGGTFTTVFFSYRRCVPDRQRFLLQRCTKWRVLCPPMVYGQCVDILWGATHYLPFLGHATFVSGFKMVALEELDFESDRYIENG
ncbi:amino acid permease-domain-containing protein [Chytriomyces sp. MP71]|nr:amino acid permease-domain-containing protein [Chytriomyces sp. MP71]